MPFDLDTWKSKFKDQLQGWKPRMQRLGVGSVYTALSTAALIPVYQAYFDDGPLAVAEEGLMTENAIVAICGAAIIITFLICVTSGSEAARTYRELAKEVIELGQA